MPKICIRQIQESWMFNRGVGHSQLMEKGIEGYGKSCVVITTNIQRAHELRRKYPYVRALTVNHESHYLQGSRIPLIVEHDAMAVLIEREVDRLYKMALWNREEKCNG